MDALDADGITYSDSVHPHRSSPDGAELPVSANPRDMEYGPHPECWMANKASEHAKQPGIGHGPVTTSKLDMKPITTAQKVTGAEEHVLVGRIASFPVFLLVDTSQLTFPLILASWLCKRV